MLQGFISFHVLESVNPSDLGLSNDCSKEEFEKALESHATFCREKIETNGFLYVNDNEIEVLDNEE